MGAPTRLSRSNRTRRRAGIVVIAVLLIGGCVWFLASRDVDRRREVAETPVPEVGGMGGGGPPPMLEGAGPPRAPRQPAGSGATAPTGNAARRGVDGEIEASTFDVEWPSIRVVGPGGAMVRRAEVQLRERGELETLSGEVRNGRVFLPRGPGPTADLSGVEIEVTAPVAVDPTLLLAPAKPAPLPSGISTFTVELRAASSIVARVTGPDGNGVPGIRVAADVVSTSALDEWWTKTHGSVVSDGDGGFRLSSLAALTYRLRPESTDEWVPDEGSAEVVATSPPARTVLRVRRARIASVSVTVLDYADRPVAGALVGVTPSPAVAKNLTGRAGLPGEPSATDERGIAVLPDVRLDAHAYIQVEPPEGRPDLRRAMAEASSDRVIVRLAKAGTISGFVRAADGSPVLDVRVAWEWRSSENGLVTVGPDGSFVLGGLPADGSIELTAERRWPGSADEPGAPNRGPSTRAEVGAREVILRFDPGAEMRFVLAQSEEVKPVNRLLEIHRVLPGDGWFRRSACFDASGVYVARHLVPGAQYTIHSNHKVVHLPGFVPLLETFVARDGDVITLRPRTPLRLSGRVFGGAEPANPSEKMVVALAPEGTPLGRVSLRPDGRFQFEGLPILPARVVVLSRDAESARDPFASVPVSRPDEVLELRLP